MDVEKIVLREVLRERPENLPDLLGDVLILFALPLPFVLREDLPEQRLGTTQRLEQAIGSLIPDELPPGRGGDFEILKLDDALERRSALRQIRSRRLSESGGVVPLR